PSPSGQQHQPTLQLLPAPNLIASSSPQFVVVVHALRPNHLTLLEPFLTKVLSPGPKTTLLNLNAQTTLPNEPRTTAQDLNHPSWRDAIQWEFDALCLNHTWDLTSTDGSIDKFKALLVAKWERSMKPYKWFGLRISLVQPTHTHMYKLRKALYALGAWYNEFKGYLFQIGSTNFVADLSLFIFRHGLMTIFLYLNLTRLDVAFNINKLSQVMQYLGSSHWVALKRILRYLAGTFMHGIHIRTPLRLGREIILSLQQGTYFISAPHRLRKQKFVARSSTEAQYKVLADTTSEIRWVQSLFVEIGFLTQQQPIIYCEYGGTRSEFQSRIKHIILSYHFVREQVQNGKLRVAYVSTDDQLVDVLTKPMLRLRFESIISKFGLSGWLSHLRGHDNDNCIRISKDY
ncbi:hypothetical protein V2J09_022259, partial [Rumex salicifolius]